MRELGVYDTLVGKSQMIKLATQVVKMLLKIDDVIAKGEKQLSEQEMMRQAIMQSGGM